MQSHFQLPIYILEYTVVPELPTSINFWFGAYVRNNFLYAASRVMVNEEECLRDILDDEGNASLANDAPRGYAVQCEPIFFNRELGCRDSLKFKILMFGWCAGLRDFFHQAVCRMCDAGFGHPKVGMRIESFSCSPVPELREAVGGTGTYRIDFVSPVSLFSNRAKNAAKRGVLDKQNGMPNFYYLILCLTRRLNRLQTAYGEEGCMTDDEIDQWCNGARNAQVEECSMRRLVLHGTPKSDSSRSICFSGYVGHMVVSGVDKGYIELLHKGQFMNVGNDTVYGLGQYRIRRIEGRKWK